MGGRRQTYAARRGAGRGRSGSGARWLACLVDLLPVEARRLSVRPALDHIPAIIEEIAAYLIARRGGLAASDRHREGAQLGELRHSQLVRARSSRVRALGACSRSRRGPHPRSRSPPAPRECLDVVHRLGRRQTHTGAVGVRRRLLATITRQTEQLAGFSRMMSHGPGTRSAPSIRRRRARARARCGSGRGASRL
jgi:hypothetical protein